MTTPPGAPSAGGISSSRALTRVGPVDPQAPVSAPAIGPSTGRAGPLGRSGLDLHELLSTTDLLATREATGSVALEVGLEQARGTLLRNLPGDALAALDSVWHGARRTEEGWYLRSGALTVLGLPGESDRVAEEGIALRPNSVALRFVQSVARLAMGDVVGARAALQPALALRVSDPVILVQHALIQARQGDSRAADITLAKLERALPDHPAVEWGRTALRTIVADATRQRSRPTPVDWPAADADIFPPAFGEEPDHASVSQTRASSPTPREVDSIADVATSALERFGARVAMRPAAEVVREARLLLRAFSAGGTLAAATHGEQAHAARSLLAAFLGSSGVDDLERRSPLRTLVEQVVPLLQQGQTLDAERLVQRQRALAREPIARLLLAVVRGASGTVARNHEMDSSRATATASSGAHYAVSGDAISRDGVVGDGVVRDAVVRDAVERGPVVPVRLGLSLLEETAAAREATRTPLGVSPIVEGITGAELDGVGWGAAQRTTLEQSHDEWEEGAGVRAVALVCVALAAGALFTGHGVVAIALGVGAAWLGLRRSGREGSKPRTDDTHERGRSQ